MLTLGSLGFGLDNTPEIENQKVLFLFDK